MELLETNAGSKFVKGKSILIYGACTELEHPKILEEASKGKTKLSLCLEKEHMNMVVYKLATMLNLTKPPKDVTVLTIDGSPHCVQLHYAVEEAKKLTHSTIPVKHLVIINKRVVEVSPEKVKLSRYLSKI